MAVNQYPTAERLIYIGCSENDLLYEEKLGSIVGYALSKMGIQLTNSDRHKDSMQVEADFQGYSKGLSEKLGGYEPYIRNLQLGQSCRLTKEKVVNDMTTLLPRKEPEFEKVIAVAADRAVENIHKDPTLGEVFFFNRRTNEFVLSEFLVLKVFRAAENLEIIPCLFKLSCKRDEGSALLGVFQWKNSEMEMGYEERKYILNKFAIKQIIDKLKNQDYGF